MTFGIWAVLRALVVNRARLAAENAALHHQLAVLQRARRRPKLHRRDRIFWVWLSKLWSGWRDALVIVQPETVVKWHRQGFKLYWRWKSTGRGPLGGLGALPIRRRTSTTPASTGYRRRRPGLARSLGRFRGVHDGRHTGRSGQLPVLDGSLPGHLHRGDLRPRSLSRRRSIRQRPPLWTLTH